MHIVVIGAGVTGLSAAYEIATQLPNVDLTLLERAKRPGGLVHTESAGPNLLLEHGADSLFAFKPEAIDLVQELGMKDQLLADDIGPRTAYVARGSALVPLPKGMLGLTPKSALGLMFSSLLSPAQKLRLLCEPFIATRRESGEESLQGFIARRFGPAFLERILEPLISGIHGAPAELLSASAVVPNLVAYERAHGSIGRAMLHAGERKRKGPALVTLKDGMGSLPQALALRLQKHVVYGVEVRRIAANHGSKLNIELRSGSVLPADGVVLATDANTAARLCEEISVDCAHELASIERAGYASVHLAFRKADLPAFPGGTGFVVPAGEARRLKACTWVHQKWAGRAPDDVALLRCFLRPPYTSQPELVSDARRDLEDLLNITARPIFEHVVVRESALPCYTLGHPARVTRIEHALLDETRLALAGNFLRGIGLSDCVASGQKAARRLITLLCEGAESESRQLEVRAPAELIG